MERVFVKDVGRYSVGDKRDWPIDVWRNIASKSGMKMDEFSSLVGEFVKNAVGNTPLGKPPAKRKKRKT